MLLSHRRFSQKFFGIVLLHNGLCHGGQLCVVHRLGDSRVPLWHGSLPHLMQVKAVGREGAGFADFCFRWFLFSASGVVHFSSPLLMPFLNSRPPKASTIDGCLPAVCVCHLHITLPDVTIQSFLYIRPSTIR